MIPGIEFGGKTGTVEKRDQLVFFICRDGPIEPLEM